MTTDETIKRTREILDTKDMDSLLVEKIKIAAELAEAHNELVTSETEVHTVKTKGTINILYSFASIIERKINAVAEDEKRDRNVKANMDYKFRKVAKEILKPDSYTHITNLTKLPIYEMREKVKDAEKL